MNETLLTGQVTDEQIKEWKAKHKYGVYAVTIDDHIAYFKNPNRLDINCALSKADKENALSIFETLASITFLGGSENLLTDDQMFIGLSNEIKIKLDGKKANLVNL